MRDCFSEAWGAGSHLQTVAANSDKLGFNLAEGTGYLQCDLCVQLGRWASAS